MNPSRDLDEDTLKTIADKTNAKYFRAHNTEELSEIYKILDELEPVEKENQYFRPTKSLFYWPLLLAISLSLVLLLAHNIRKPA